MCCVFPTQPPKFPKPAQTPSPRPHPDTTPPPLTDVDYDEVAADEMQEEEEEEEGGDCQTLKVCLSVCLALNTHPYRQSSLLRLTSDVLMWPSKHCALIQ